MLSIYHIDAMPIYLAINNRMISTIQNIGFKKKTLKYQLTLTSQAHSKEAIYSDSQSKVDSKQLTKQ